MTEKFVKGITEIVSEFVPEVAEEMLKTARRISERKSFVKLVEEFYERFQAEHDVLESNIKFFMEHDVVLTCTTEPSCLTHSKCYRAVINDILKKQLVYND